MLYNGAQPLGMAPRAGYLFLGLCGAACQSPCHDTGAGEVCGSREVRVPVLDEVHHWPIVTAKVNGQEMRMLVDTGAGGTIVSAALLGVKDGAGVVLMSLCIADLCLQQVPVRAEDNQIVRATPSPDLPEIHALLGADILRHARVELDRGRSVGIAFSGSRCRGAAEPFRVDEWGRPFLPILADGVLIEDVLVDSGARFTLLDQASLDMLEPYLQEQAQPATSCAVDDCSELSLSRLHELCVGATCVKDVATKYPSWKALGASFFAQGRFVIDGPAKELVACD